MLTMFNSSVTLEAYNYQICITFSLTSKHIMKVRLLSLRRVLVEMTTMYSHTLVCTDEKDKMRTIIHHLIIMFCLCINLVTNLKLPSFFISQICLQRVSDARYISILQKNIRFLFQNVKIALNC